MSGYQSNCLDKKRGFILACGHPICTDIKRTRFSFKKREMTMVPIWNKDYDALDAECHLRPLLHRPSSSASSSTS